MSIKIFLIPGIFTFFIGMQCYAQVQVSEEPRHHNVFQNDYVRVLDVHISPHDTSLFHKHELSSVFIVLSNAKTGSELISDDTMVRAPVTYGNIWFDGFYTKPRIHRVWNSDTIEFHVMDVELFKKTYKEIGPPLQHASIRMLFDEKPVRGYACTLAGGSAVNVGEGKSPVLVVGISGVTNKVTISGKIFEKTGDFIFIPEGKSKAFINNGTEPTKLAIFELK